jgi:hypothetical protein
MINPIADHDSVVMDTVLDLDLDFFVWPPFRREPIHERLPESECQSLMTAEEVCGYLEGPCHLSKQTRIPGQEFDEHQDAFHTWRRWLHEGKLSSPFCVIHVDGHADLGSAFRPACKYIETELLALPIAHRYAPRFGPDGLDSGSYLLGAIANHWISRLVYVYPTKHRLKRSKCAGGLLAMDSPKLSEYQPPVPDLVAWVFQNNDWRTGNIQLKHRGPDDARETDRIHAEPIVPFRLTEEIEFGFSGFTHMVVSRSPQYTPLSADDLLPTIREYFHLT